MLYEHISFYRVQQERKIITQQYHCPDSILVTNHTVLSSNLPSNLHKNTVNITTSELTHPLALCLQIQISTKTMQQKNISFFIFFHMSNPGPCHPPTCLSPPPRKPAANRALVVIKLGRGCELWITGLHGPPEGERNNGDLVTNGPNGSSQPWEDRYKFIMYRFWWSDVFKWCVS